MPFAVLLTDDAAGDLREIFAYIDRHDVQGKADYVLDRIQEVLDGLAEHPHRGAYPKELLAFGLREYREVLFKPYRIVYRVVEHKVYILLVADGRRDMQSLLQRRLLQP